MATPKAKSNKLWMEIKSEYQNEAINFLIDRKIKFAVIENKKKKFSTFFIIGKRNFILFVKQPFIIK